MGVFLFWGSSGTTEGAEHYWTISHAGIPSILHFLLRTVGSIDFLFWTSFCQGSNLDKNPCDIIFPAWGLYFTWSPSCGIFEYLWVLDWVWYFCVMLCRHSVFNLCSTLVHAIVVYKGSCSCWELDKIYLQAWSNPEIVCSTLWYYFMIPFLILWI